MPKPKCPRCGRKGTPIGSGETARCNHCDATFDAVDPDEGGDYSDHNPAARLEREERRQQPRRAR